MSFTCPVPLQKYPHVVMGHGSGGLMTQELIDHLFVPAFYGKKNPQLTDAAVLDGQKNSSIAFTTDSFVINPLIFPGGSIGSLAIHGTVNDLAAMGAVPQYISVAFILEEGLSFETLSHVVSSMAQAVKQAHVSIVTGDTKVVEKGHGDGIYINTTGIGTYSNKARPHPNSIRTGDVLIVNGTLGDHGMAIMSVRENLAFETAITSDSASLNDLVQAVQTVCPDIHTMRDITRGGLAAIANELAMQANVGFQIKETDVPVQPQVASACEIMGLDPLFVANEGKMLFVVPKKDATAVLKTMKKHKYGKQAAIIGSVVKDHPGMVVGITAIGSERVIDIPAGELLPRIC